LASLDTRPDFTGMLTGFRLRDRWFFPLALLLAAAMIALAISPGIGNLPRGAVAGDGKNYNQIDIAGAYLNKIYAGGNAITELTRGENGAYAMYIEAAAGALSDAPELGPHFRLDADIELQFAARTVRVTVRARPAGDRGARQIAVNYAAGRAGESGWKVFDLLPGANDYSFEFSIPAHVGEPGFDYLAIRPVVPEKTRAVIIDSVRLERLETSPNAVPPS
jgi:hypothetical protein